MSQLSSLLHKQYAAECLLAALVRAFPKLRPYSKEITSLGYLLRFEACELSQEVAEEALRSFLSEDLAIQHLDMVKANAGDMLKKYRCHWQNKYLDDDPNNVAHLIIMGSYCGLCPEADFAAVSELSAQKIHLFRQDADGLVIEVLVADDKYQLKKLIKNVALYEKQSSFEKAKALSYVTKSGAFLTAGLAQIEKLKGYSQSALTALGYTEILTAPSDFGWMSPEFSKHFSLGFVDQRSFFEPCGLFNGAGAHQAMALFRGKWGQMAEPLTSALQFIDKSLKLLNLEYQLVEGHALTGSSRSTPFSKKFAKKGQALLDEALVASALKCECLDTESNPDLEIDESAFEDLFGVQERPNLVFVCADGLGRLWPVSSVSLGLVKAESEEVLLRFSLFVSAERLLGLVLENHSQNGFEKLERIKASG